ncbi:MAG: 50S ribosomal protein L25 [Proteobacteria bacterium]|nr:50S ribosomal protein L25 [Pseudomonadota bacterium]MCP4916998.1 50S ribosomal protein L25 [Pseudomonadota bacterium]
MDATPLQATAREQFGKGAARKMRSAGQIPALVYRAGSEPTHIAVDPAELRLLFARSGNPNMILTVDVGSGPKNCILTATQKHPLTRELLHADFYEVVADKKVTVNVPVAAVGKPKGAVLGGKLQILRREVPLRCLPQNIPAALEIDVTDMDLGDFLRVSSLTTPEGTTVATEQDFNIFSLKGRRLEAEDAEGEDEVAAESDDS